MDDRVIAAALVALTLIAAQPVVAAVTAVEIHSREIVAEGERFGTAGPYEKISGRLLFAIDPTNTANRSIRDVDRAPVNRRGRVEFSADFYLLKPVEIARGNNALVFEVPNRGRKGILQMFSDAEGSLDPTERRNFGDGFFQKRGYTLLWVGWQFDPPDEPGLLRAYPPSAGSDVSGSVRSDFVVRRPTLHHSLGDRDQIAYPADMDDPDAILTVRDTPDGERTAIDRNRWSFGRVENGRVVPDPRYVTLDGGFTPDRIYEVVYQSADPPIAGFGLAAVRDTVTALRHDGIAELGIAAGDIDRALAFGISQSGRMLRQFLYDGFNADEASRRVFDGVHAHIAGGARGSFNHRFAQASRASWSFLYPNAIFPFSDAEQTDPNTGRRDGLLAGIAPEHQPKTIYTNSSNEYWRGSAALTHVTIDGSRDLELPANVRSYLLAGTQHTPAGFPPGGGDGQLAPNPNEYRWFLRALLIALDRWTQELAAPPPSVLPRLADGTLVPRDAIAFPALPAVSVPADVRPVRHIDYGSRFAATGVIEREPPATGAAFPLLLPQVDADGNEIAGLRSPAVAVPLATYTGWNLYHSLVGPSSEMVPLLGSFIPFAPTAEIRLDGDGRAAINERYADRNDYLGRVTAHTLGLIESDYVLADDLAAIAKEALDLWHYATDTE